MTARPVSSTAASPVTRREAVTSGPSVLKALRLTLRPEQWTKNLLVFAGVMFGGHLLDGTALVHAVGAFVAFCALSSTVYIFNDLADREADTQHPLKCMRPIAAGDLSPTVAIAAGVVLAGAALKHLVIVDVLVIAGGFVLRAVAGAVAIDVPISHWLLICTTLLALFLALSKRRHELTLLGNGAIGHRRILEEYSPYLLDQMIAVVTASTLVAYTLYTTDAATTSRLGTSRLGLTIPFVLYGIFRYLYLIHQKRGGGNPSTMLVTDRPLLACVALWALSVAVILYFPLG